MIMLALVLVSREARADDRRDDPPASDETVEPFRIGAIAGVGFPHPLAIEGLVKIEDVVAFGIEYAVLPKTTIGGVQTSLWSLSGDLRVFPFKGAFFVGARVGRQRIDAS